MWAYIIVGFASSATSFLVSYWLWERWLKVLRAEEAVIKARDASEMDGYAARLDDFKNQAEVSVRRNAILLVSELRRL
jgi:hypothetical protein